MSVLKGSMKDIMYYNIYTKLLKSDLKSSFRVQQSNKGLILYTIIYILPLHAF